MQNLQGACENSLLYLTMAGYDNILLSLERSKHHHKPLSPVHATLGGWQTHLAQAELIRAQSQTGLKSVTVATAEKNRALLIPGQFSSRPDS